MSSLRRAVASLSLNSEALDPEEISELLGAKPTRSWRKGDNIRRRADLEPNYARRGHWRLEATPTEPENFDAQVLELLSAVTEDLEVWHALSREHRVSIFCGWYMSSWNDGVVISPLTLSAIGARNISLDLDIYANSEESIPLPYALPDGIRTPPLPP